MTALQEATDRARAAWDRAQGRAPLTPEEQQAAREAEVDGWLAEDESTRKTPWRVEDGRMWCVVERADGKREEVSAQAASMEDR